MSHSCGCQSGVTILSLLGVSNRLWRSLASSWNHDLVSNNPSMGSGGCIQLSPGIRSASSAVTEMLRWFLGHLSTVNGSLIPRRDLLSFFWERTCSKTVLVQRHIQLQIWWIPNSSLVCKTAVRPRHEDRVSCLHSKHHIDGLGTRILVSHSVPNLLGSDLSLLGRKTNTTFA